jgi:hypothetical protein
MWLTMHIQCKDTKEFIAFMRVCEYLHYMDLDVDKYPMLNTIRHLYLGVADFPDKAQFVSIKGRKTLPDRDKTRWGTVKPRRQRSGK